MADKDKKNLWIDPQGNKVPVKYIEKPVKVRDRLVERLVKKALDLNRRIVGFRQEFFDGVEQYLNDLEKHYDMNGRTAQGNKILSNFSNTQRVELKNAKFIEFDERLSLAKGSIDECIKRWSDGANDNLKVVVSDAFKVDKKGNIDRNRVLSLTKLQIKDKEWAKAMKVITDSLTVTGTRSYIRVAVKQANGEWENIALDIARV